METQLVPLLPGSNFHHHHQSSGISFKILWHKMKQNMHQITKELTSPPTTGAVSLNSIIYYPALTILLASGGNACV